MGRSTDPLAHSIGIEVAGLAPVVVELRGSVDVGSPFRFDLEAWIEGEPPTAASLTGAAAKLALCDTFDDRLVVHGIVTRASCAVSPLGGTFLGLTMEPPLAALRLGRDDRAFCDMTVCEVARWVIEHAGIPSDEARWETLARYPARPYWAQTGESDWAFLERLFAEHGLFVWFDFSDDRTVLVVSDDSTRAPPIPGQWRVPYRDDHALAGSSGSVTRVEARWRETERSIALADYDPARPRLSLEGRAGEGPGEVFDYPGRFTDPDEGARLARVRLEALRAERFVVRGETSTTRVRSGSAFELVGHPVPALDGPLFVCSVRYEATLPSGTPTFDPRHHPAPPLRIRWSAIPLATPYRSPLRACAPPERGPQTAVVVGNPGEEIDTDSSGRVRVRLHRHRTGPRREPECAWMRAAQLPISGSMAIPRVGWEVLVHHDAGDAERPAVVAHLRDGARPSPYPLPEHRTRTVWRTDTTPGGGSVNEIRFEDAQGREEMVFTASRDMRIAIGDASNETVGANASETIGANRAVSIGANVQVGIGADQSTTIGGSDTLTAGGSGRARVAGSLAATIGGSRSASVAGGVTCDAKGGRSLVAGGAMIAASGLGVTRNALGSLSLAVGGAWVAAAGTGVSAATGGAAAEAVGGAKISVGGSSCSTSVQGPAVEAIGGAYVIGAGGNAGETAGAGLAITGGGAFVAAAPSIAIEAEAEIAILVPGSSLVLTPGCVELKAPVIQAPAAAIAKKAGAIEHN